MHSSWGPETTGTEVTGHLKGNIQGRNILITGVSPKSLGESTALAIARHEPSRLVLASRTLTKLQQVADEISKTGPNVTVLLVELDLASQRSVREAAVEIQRIVDRVDVMINNAAVVTSDRRETAEGIELQFGTTHIGHWLLTNLLTPQLLAAAEKAGQPGSTRVVNLSSAGYRLSPMRFHDYNFEGKPIPPEEEPAAGVPPHMKPDLAAGKPYNVFCSYGQSKTANILHAVGLNNKLGDRGVKAFAVHPGSIWTDLSRNLTPKDLKVIEGTSGFWKDLDQGVATTLVAAFDSALSNPDKRVYLSDCHLEDAADHATDPAIAEKLWQLSEKLTEESAQL